MTPGWSNETRQMLLDNCAESCPFAYDEFEREEIIEDWEVCSFTYDNCKYWFSHSPFRPFQQGPSNVVLHLVRDEETDELAKFKCPKDPDFVGIILGVVAMIVMVGLVTILLWKAFTTIHDRREFARFERERMKVKFPAHSNPIFKQATTTVQNPIFMKQD